MQAIKDLFNSERGIIALALLIGATVLAGLTRLTPDQWVDYTKWIFGIFTVGKTATGVVAAMTNASTAKAVAQAQGSSPSKSDVAVSTTVVTSGKDQS